MRRLMRRCSTYSRRASMTIGTRSLALTVKRGQRRTGMTRNTHVPVVPPQNAPTIDTPLRRTKFRGNWSRAEHTSRAAARDATHAFDLATREANDNQAALPSSAFQGIWSTIESLPAPDRQTLSTSDHPDGVVDDVHALAARDLQDLLLPVWLGVVDRVVSATVFDSDIEFLLRACRGDDFRSESLRRVNIARIGLCGYAYPCQVALRTCRRLQQRRGQEAIHLRTLRQVKEIVRAGRT